MVVLMTSIGALPYAPRFAHSLIEECERWSMEVLVLLAALWCVAMLCCLPSMASLSHLTSLIPCLILLFFFFPLLPLLPSAAATCAAPFAPSSYQIESTGVAGPTRSEPPSW